MYSIVRFTAEHNKLSELEGIGVRMNSIREGTFDGLRKRGDGFSVSVSSSSEWLDHLKGVMTFLDTFDELVRAARNIAARVTFDIAIEPDDKLDRIANLVFENDILNRLASLQIRLEVAVY